MSKSTDLIDTQLNNILALQVHNSEIKEVIFKLLGEHYEKEKILEILLTKIVKRDDFDIDLLLHLFDNKYTLVEELNNIKKDGFTGLQLTQITQATVDIAALIESDETVPDSNCKNPGNPFDEPSHTGFVITKDGATQNELDTFGGKPPDTDIDGLVIDVIKNNVRLDKGSLQPDNLLKITNESIGSFNVPTNAKPSPLFDAQPWTQRFYRFEEFGDTPQKDLIEDPLLEFPAPTAFNQFADDYKIEKFLRKGVLEKKVVQKPGQFNNDAPNPWRTPIGEMLGDANFIGTAEGRGYGECSPHLLFDKFPPLRTVITGQFPARTNKGLRDTKQLHNYRLGEFGPGGLYHTTFEPLDSVTGTPINGTTNGIPVAFHPKFPTQTKETLWTFDGTFPLKLEMSRMGFSTILRQYNGLPIDPSQNAGYGSHVITLHQHNGHVDSTSDGYAEHFYFPGQYYDYHWPMILGGATTVNLTAQDPRAGTPNETNGIDKIPGDYRMTMSTHWAHDHTLDFTSQNVYKGNAIMMNIYSSIDRGNEVIEDEVNLRFPSGNALSWGNRDYDVNLMIKDKAWDENGQLWFDPIDTPGFLGDRLLSNYQWKPVLNVRKRRYRFRILNAGVSRILKLAVVVKRHGDSGEYKGPLNSNYSFDTLVVYAIAYDGNIMQNSIAFDGSRDDTQKGLLPVQIMANRQDIIIDFNSQNIGVGDEVYFVNTMESKIGRRGNKVIDLQEILNGSYENKPIGQHDPCITMFLQMKVFDYPETDLSMDPAEYVVGKKRMLPLHLPSREEILNAKIREFKFVRQEGGGPLPWKIETCSDESNSALDPTPFKGKKALPMDPFRLSAGPTQETGEIWILKAPGGWSHPIHIHVEEAIHLLKDGERPSLIEQLSRGDMFNMGRKAGGVDGAGEVVLFYRFRDVTGKYMMHCHNNVHEDKAMLLRWDILEKGTKLQVLTEVPTWDRVTYKKSYVLQSFLDGCNPVRYDNAWRNDLIETIDREYNEDNEEGRVVFPVFSKV